MSKAVSKHRKKPQKPVAETLFDEILFRQPESTHLGDCPICSLPMALTKPYTDDDKQFHFQCCSKSICNGCFVAYFRPKMTDDENICPFCRTPASKSNNGKTLMWDGLKKRIEVGDPIAMTRMGSDLIEARDYKGAFGYLSKAAALGNIEAHGRIAEMYLVGFGVEKDEAKCMHHLEQAAIGGHPHSRYLLAALEETNLNARRDRAAKHCLIAAKLGHDGALKKVKEFYVSGFVSKEDFAAALREHQAAIDANKSDQRTKAEEILSPGHLPSTS